MSHVVDKEWWKLYPETCPPKTDEYPVTLAKFLNGVEVERRFTAHLMFDGTSDTDFVWLHLENGSWEPFEHNQYEEDGELFAGTRVVAWGENPKPYGGSIGEI